MLTTFERHKSLECVRLNTRFPCCGRRSMIRALVDVPKQTHERCCPECGQRWTVTRTVLRVDAGKRIDKLEWERTTTPRTIAGKGEGS